MNADRCDRRPSSLSRSPSFQRSAKRARTTVDELRPDRTTPSTPQAAGSPPGRPESAAPTRLPGGSPTSSRGFARAGRCGSCQEASSSVPYSTVWMRWAHPPERLGQAGSRLAFVRWRPVARTPCGSSRLHRNWASRGAASTGTSRTGARCWTRCSTPGSAGPPTRCSSRWRARGATPREKVRRAGHAHLLPRAPANRPRGPRLGPARPLGGQAPSPRRQPSHGVPALPDRRTSVRTEDEIEARSMLAFSLAIGNHFIAAHHGPRSRGAVLEQAIQRVLASGATYRRRRRNRLSCPSER